MKKDTPAQNLLKEHMSTYPLGIEMWARILAIAIIVDVKTVFAIFQSDNIRHSQIQITFGLGLLKIDFSTYSTCNSISCNELSTPLLLTTKVY